MQIAGYLKTSLIEWPGKITSVVFVPGCNFRCPFCHNRDLVGNRGLTLIDEKLIFADLRKRKKWVDGVAVTGGEPCLQSDLPDFLKKIKKMGFLTMVETNGSEPEVISKLVISNLVNFIAMDVKGNFADYQNFTNVKCKMSNVKSSMEIILKSGVECEFRTTVVPGLHDKRILIQMAEELRDLFVSSQLSVASIKWYLQNFRPKNCLDPEFNKLKPFTKGELEGFLKEVRKVIPQAELRGA